MVPSRLFEDYSPSWGLTIRVEIPLGDGVETAEIRRRVLSVLQTAGVPSRLANINISQVSQTCFFEFPVHDWEVGWFVQWMVHLCRSRACYELARRVASRVSMRVAKATKCSPASVTCPPPPEPVRMRA